MSLLSYITKQNQSMINLEQIMIHKVFWQTAEIFDFYRHYIVF